MSEESYIPIVGRDHPVHVEQHRIRCACRRTDAYDCMAARYPSPVVFAGWDEDELDEEREPCECVCHDADEDDEDD